MRVAQVIVVSGRELARGVESDFVQHPPEINEATDFIVATAQTRNVWHWQRSVRADAVANLNPPTLKLQRTRKKTGESDRDQVFEQGDENIFNV